MSIVRSLLVKIAADSQELSKGLAAAQKTLSTTADKMGSIGQKLAVSVTAPLAAIGTISVKTFTDFEKGVKKISTVADESVMSTKQISAGVRKLSKDVNMGTDDISNALYETISATGDTATALDYTEIAAKAAKGGFADTATAVNGLTTVMNAYGLKGKEAMMTVSDQMIMAQNYGKTTFAEMAASIGNVIPIAASLSVSTKDLFASLAVLTKSGIKTSEAVTGLKAAYSNIIKPSEQAKKMANSLGLQFNSTRLKSVGWAKFLEEIKAKTKGNTDTMATLFGSVEALNTVTVLAGTGAEDFSNALTSMDNSAGSTETAFNAMSSGTGESFNRLKINLQDLAIQIGETLAPKLNIIVDAVSKVVAKFGELDPSTQSVIIGFGIFAAAIAPVIMLIGGICSGISGLISIGAALTPAFTAIGAVIAGISAPVWIVVGVIAALTAAFAILWNTNEGFRNGVIGIWENIKSFGITCFGGLRTGLIAIFEGLKSWWNDWGSRIQTAFNTILTPLVSYCKKAFNGIVEGAKLIFNGLKDFWNTWGGLIQSVFSTQLGLVVNVFKLNWGLIGNFIQLAMTTISNTIGLILNLIQGNWSGAWENIKNIFGGFKTYAENNLNTLKTFFIDSWTILKDGVVNIVTILVQKLSKFFTQDLPYSIGFAVGKAVEFFSTLPGKIYTFITELPTKIKTIFDSIKTNIQTALTNLPSILGDIFQSAKDAVFDKINSIKSIVTDVIDKIKGAIETIKNFNGTNVASKSVNVVKNVVEKVSTSFSNGLTAATKHADGGIFTKPTLWGSHLIGEAGAEALVPLDKLESMIGGNGQQPIFYLQLDGQMIQLTLDNKLGKTLALGGV